ncbi:MAG: hypothetical protein Q4C12_08770 [Clostridia bacterium]|nr:hypothetical protein [Clostridia bacterium]
MYHNFFDNLSAARPFVVWQWNGKLTAAHIEDMCALFEKCGKGGIILSMSAGLVTRYLSSRYIDALRSLCRSCARHHLDLYIGDGAEFSDTNGMQSVLRAPSYRAHTLTSDSADGELYCESGEMRVYCTPSPVIDVFNPHAVDEFIESTHERLKRGLLKFFGYEIKGVFMFKTNFAPKNAVPYSPYLERYYEQTCSANLKENATELFFDVGNFEQTRLNYKNCADVLYVQTYLKKCSDWCHENGILLAGRFSSLLPETSLEYIDIPAIFQNDCDNLCALAKAAEQNGKKTIFGICTQDAAAQFCAHGINKLADSNTLYTFAGERKYLRGTFLKETNADIECERSKTNARMCSLAEGTMDAKCCENPSFLFADGALVTHRKKDADDIYFIVNPTNSECTVEIKKSDTRNLYALDFVSGDILAAPLLFALPPQQCCSVICSLQKLDLTPRASCTSFLRGPQKSVKALSFTPYGSPLRVITLDLISGSFGGTSFSNQSAQTLRTEYIALQNGTRFDVYYEFTLDSVPKGELFVAIETASALECILLNGQRLSDVCGCWLDEAFQKLCVTGLVKTGKNRLEISGVKQNNFTTSGESVSSDDPTYSATELGSAFLLGEFDSGFAECTTYNCILPEEEIASSALSLYGNFYGARILIGKRTIALAFPPYRAELFSFEAGKDVQITVFGESAPFAGDSSAPLLDSVTLEA